MKLNPGDRVVHYEPENCVEPTGVAVVSGGMDSITMVYHLLNEGHIPHLLSFDYGQRHKKELQFALLCAQQLDLKWSLVDLTSITGLIDNSALTSPYDPMEGRAVEVPEGHYAEGNMALTVVPNRNMTMMSIALSACINMKGHFVAAGMHAGDHAQYPDCRPQFVADFYIAALSANRGFIADDFTVEVPWIHKSKNDIAQVAFDLGVPLGQTWSCYKGEETHCGRCGTCVERLEAIASVETDIDWDRTVYADSEYWKQAVAEFKTAK